MHRKILLNSAALFIAASLAGEAAAQAGPDLYFGFTRLDPDTQTVHVDNYLIVEEGRITAVGSGTPPDAQYDAEYDMGGTYALSGFIDAHGHITAGPHAVEIVDGVPMITMESRSDVTEFHARMALAFGVTTVRNPGGDPEANAEYDLRIANGDWSGPDAIHAGAVMQPAPMGGNAFAYPETREGWFAEAERQAALGMRYFKLYHGLTPEEIGWGIEAAHAQGLRAIAHLDQVSWLTAIELGIDDLTHALPTSANLLEPEQRPAYLAQRAAANTRFMYIWFEMANFDAPILQQLFHEMSENEIAVDLTLLVNALIYLEDGPDRFVPAGDEQFYHPDAYAAAAQFLSLARLGWTDEDYIRADAAMDKVFDFLHRLRDAGVPVLIGTDSAGGGPSYAYELGLHVEAGLSEWEVLYMATGGNADILGLGHETGRLTQGYEADIVFLAADPLVQIENVRHVQRVVANGVSFTFEELTREPPHPPSSSPSQTQE